MSTARITSLEKLLGGPRDGALLRYALGNEYLTSGEPANALPHLQQAVSLDPAYSAAWKLLAKALAADHQPAQALQAYETGIAVAMEKGDVQAAREMRVFAKRLAKPLSGPAG